MQRVLSVRGLAAVTAVFLVMCLMACGGGGNQVNVASTIILAPTTISLNEGAVTTLSAVVEDAQGNTVAADITFSSNNTSVATVSSGGLVCGGVWDANIINCNATQGSGGVGTATITATTQNNVTATATVYVHERVDSVQAVLTNSCTTMGQQVAIQGLAFSTSAPGCSPSAPCNITNTVGPFTFGSNDTTIVSVSSAGTLTAGTPGATTVSASVSGVNSVGVSYLTCPVVRISVHDANSDNTTFTLNPAATQPLTADVFDSNAQYIKPVLTWTTSSVATATAATGTSGNNPGTVTAVTGGTAYITASCSYPDCNKYIPAQYSQNIVTVNVTQPSPTTVFAASTSSTKLVPISTSSNAPGSAITLPAVPNSLVANSSGTVLFLGSDSSGLMEVDPSSGTVLTVAVNGTIEAISPDGNYLLLSDSAANALRYFIVASQTLASTFPGVTVNSDVYTPDAKFNEWVTGTQLGAALPTGSPSVTTLTNSANALDVIAEGGLTYITSASSAQIAVFSTCNQSQEQLLSATAPTLIKAIPNGTGAVAADSPNLDVISTPIPLSAGCPLTTQSTINSFPLNAGSFTAQQVVVSPDSTQVWIVSNLPDILNFNLSSLTPTTIALAGGATAFNGGLTLDGAHLYVGASDGTVHRIDTATLSDAAQIPVSLPDSNGSPTAPNLVTVLP